MAVPMKVLRMRGVPIFQQLRVEELLLRNDPRPSNWFIINHGVPKPTIVLGLGGKVDELVDTNMTVRDGVELIRRYSGGGTVILDKDTYLTSVIMNAKDADCKPYPREMMAWSDEQIFGAVFDKISETENFSLRENDYVIGNRKIGGNAQSITKDRWVHHTSFLWDFRPSNMQYLLMPKKRPEYRQDRDHNDFLVPLCTYFNNVDELEDRILMRISEQYDVEHVDYENNDFHAYLEEIRGGQDWAKCTRTKIVDVAQK
jgi:lipoate-protein ligase A